jgi:hypothetical protein
LRRIRVAVSLVVVLVLAATMAALPAFAGATTTDEGNGSSGTKDGFGAVVSQKASTYHDMGEHSRDPDRDSIFGEQREGVGNVAREDGGPGGHGCVVGTMDDTVGADPEHVTDCENEPGKPG